MPRHASIHPTQAELEILNVLWRQGPSTVRQVHDAVQAGRQIPTTLTTTLKMLQLMVEKHLVVRMDMRPHQYRAAARQEQTQAGLVEDLVRRAFDGSVHKLLVRAVEDADLSGDELKALRQLIDHVRDHTRGDKS